MFAGCLNLIIMLVSLLLGLATEEIAWFAVPVVLYLGWSSVKTKQAQFELEKRLEVLEKNYSELKEQLVRQDKLQTTEASVELVEDEIAEPFEQSLEQQETTNTPQEFEPEPLPYHSLSPEESQPLEAEPVAVQCEDEVAIESYQSPMSEIYEATQKYLPLWFVQANRIVKFGTLVFALGLIFFAQSLSETGSLPDGAKFALFQTLAVLFLVLGLKQIGSRPEYGGLLQSLGFTSAMIGFYAAFRWWGLISLQQAFFSMAFVLLCALLAAWVQNIFWACFLVFQVAFFLPLLFGLQYFISSDSSLVMLTVYNQILLGLAYGALLLRNWVSIPASAIGWVSGLYMATSEVMEQGGYLSYSYCSLMLFSLACCSTYTLHLRANKEALTHQNKLLIAWFKYYGALLSLALIPDPRWQLFALLTFWLYQLVELWVLTVLDPKWAVQYLSYEGYLFCCSLVLLCFQIPVERVFRLQVVVLVLVCVWVASTTRLLARMESEELKGFAINKLWIVTLGIPFMAWVWYMSNSHLWWSTMMAILPCVILLMAAQANPTREYAKTFVVWGWLLGLLALTSWLGQYPITVCNLYALGAAGLAWSSVQPNAPVSLQYAPSHFWAGASVLASLWVGSGSIYLFGVPLGLLLTSMKSTLVLSQLWYWIALMLSLELAPYTLDDMLHGNGSFAVFIGFTLLSLFVRGWAVHPNVFLGSVRVMPLAITWGIIPELLAPEAFFNDSLKQLHSLEFITLIAIAIGLHVWWLYSKDQYRAEHDILGAIIRLHGFVMFSLAGTLFGLGTGLLPIQGTSFDMLLALLMPAVALSLSLVSSPSAKLDGSIGWHSLYYGVAQVVGVIGGVSSLLLLVAYPFAEHHISGLSVVDITTGLSFALLTVLSSKNGDIASQRYIAGIPVTTWTAIFVTIGVWVNLFLLRWYSVSHEYDSLLAGLVEQDFQVILSGCWALQATCMMVLGSRFQVLPWWRIGYGLWYVILAKLLFVDLNSLAGTARALSFLIVGGLMVGLGFVPKPTNEAIEQ